MLLAPIGILSALEIIGQISTTTVTPRDRFIYLFISPCPGCFRSQITQYRDQSWGLYRQQYTCTAHSGCHKHAFNCWGFFGAWRVGSGQNGRRSSSETHWGGGEGQNWRGRVGPCRGWDQWWLPPSLRVSRVRLSSPIQASLFLPPLQHRSSPGCREEIFNPILLSWQKTPH